MAVLQPHFATIQPGDFNFDGTVNAADYTVWRDALGQTGAGLDADSNLDGIVDENDYEAWAANFGDSLGGAGGGSTAAVPEPGAIALAVVGCMAIGVSGRRSPLCRRRR